MSKLLSQYTDPTNTVRATTIDQMYSVVPPLTPFSMSYDMGIPESAPVETYAFRNHTLSNRLQFDVVVPPFIDAQTIIPIGVEFYITPKNSFIVAPQSEVTMSFVPISAQLEQMPVNTTQYAVTITVTVLDVVGPVFLPAS